MDHGSSFLNFNFSIDVSFDFDVADEMASMRKKQKTDEEIAQCTTDDSFTHLQKAIFIMRRGNEVQKKSVVSHLHNYMIDPDANTELVPLILNSIENWDTEIQCLLAESLCTAVVNKCHIDASNISKAIGLALEYVDNLNSETLYSSWRNTFPKLV